MRFSGVEILFGLFAMFTVGFTSGMVAEHMFAQESYATCRELP